MNFFGANFLLKWCFVVALICLCAAFPCVVAYKDVVSLSPNALEEEHNIVLETVVVEKIGPLEDVL